MKQKTKKQTKTDEQIIGETRRALVRLNRAFKELSDRNISPSLSEFTQRDEETLRSIRGYTLHLYFPTP